MPEIPNHLVATVDDHESRIVHLQKQVQELRKMIEAMGNQTANHETNLTKLFDFSGLKK